MRTGIARFVFPMLKNIAKTRIIITIKAADTNCFEKFSLLSIPLARFNAFPQLENEEKEDVLM
jgi:hypothetical protein